MKTHLILALSLAATVAVGAADAPASCCAPSAPVAVATPSCCAEEKPSAPLSNRSIYQLDTAWTNDGGQRVKLASFRGKPVVLAMFFASCEYACPVLVNDMKRLRAALPDAERAKTQFVLVTFDIARDTVPALKAFRERMALDEQWTLLRADDSAVQELAMLLGVKFKQDARGQFAHSNLLTILNPEGEVAHQHFGLNGDISLAAKALQVVAK